MGRFAVRKNQRFRESVPVLYQGKEVAGEGMVKDVSLSGWQIKGSEPVSVGMPLVLRVFLPGEPEPLRIDRVTVQWVKGVEFGVEFDTPSRKVMNRADHRRARAEAARLIFSWIAQEKKQSVRNLVCLVRVRLKLRLSMLQRRPID